MKLKWYHLPPAALLFLILGLFLGSEIGVGVADTLGRFIKIEAEVTAYSPSPHITSGDPFVTASNLRVTPQDLEQLKYVALSRDLLEDYDIPWGSTVWISFTVEDKMGPKATKGVDIFFRNIDLARRFGRQERTIIIERRVK